MTSPLSWYWIPLYPLRNPLSSRIVQFSLLLNLINLLRWLRRIWAPFHSPRFTHRNLTCFKSGVSHFSAIPLSGSRGRTFWCEYGISQYFFQDFTDCCVISSFYVSVNSKPDRPPWAKRPGNFLMAKFPTPWAKRKFKTPTPWAYKIELKPHPGHFPQLFTIKT